MSKYERLFEPRYYLLCYMTGAAKLIGDEYVVMETIDEMVDGAGISKRSIARHLKELEADGLIAKSKFHGKKYMIPDDVRSTVLQIKNIVEGKEKQPSGIES